MLLNKLIKVLLFFLFSSSLYAIDENNKKEKAVSIKKNWDVLIKYWKEHNITKYGENFVCQGLENNELLELKTLYEEIPNDYLTSLKICATSKDEKGEFYYFIDKSGWGQLYGVQDIIKANLNYPKNSYISAKGAYEFVYGDVKNPEMLFPKQWIPIYDWNGDYIVAIDMLSKNKGQVIVFCVEDSILAKWTDSYEEWFKLAVDEVLKHGELRVETIENVLHIPQE